MRRIALIAFACLGVAACSPTSTGTVGGAAVGATAGAVVGGPVGAVVGGTVGAVTGGSTGAATEAQGRRMAMASPAALRLRRARQPGDRPPRPPDHDKVLRRADPPFGEANSGVARAGRGD